MNGTAPRYRALPLGGSLTATFTPTADGATLVRNADDVLAALANAPERDAAAPAAATATNPAAAATNPAAATAKPARAARPIVPAAAPTSAPRAR